MAITESLAGQTALITGAARRLGRATALALAAEGVHLVVHYRESAAEAEALCAEATVLGVRAAMLQADLDQPDAVEALIPRALSAAGPLHILINNASVFPPDTLETMTCAHLEENIRINAWAPFALTRAFAQHGAGVVINLLDARRADPTHIPYMLSKLLLAELTRMTALAYAPRVRVNAVAPGLILPPAGKDESYLAALTAQVPLARHGDPEDITHAMLYLIKERFLTGQTIYVDGGRHLCF